MLKHRFILLVTVACAVIASLLVSGCADGDEALGTQFAALTDESRSACMERCEEAEWPAERCEAACANQRQDPCYEECHASGKTGEECREECGEVADDAGNNGMSAEEMAAYQACEAECLESGKDPIECREECSPQ